MVRLDELELTPWRPASEADQRCAAGVSAHLISRLQFVTDWRLQKSFFLAEVRSIEERLSRLSRAEFASWNYGPWSLHVREAEESLEAAGVIVRVSKKARRRPEAEFLTISDSAKVPPIRDEDREFLEGFAQDVQYVDGERLTAMAKATPPFMRSKPRELIDLDGYLEDLKARHGRFVRSDKVARLVAQAKAEP